MIDFHMHSLLSDGDLLPSELVRRAAVAGYTALAVTDHADESNVEAVLKQIVKAARQLTKCSGVRVAPGVELTHIPPSQIPLMVKKARSLGAKVIVGHGETLAEPVAPGTNLAYIRSGVDVLAHPGLVTEDECVLAVRNGVIFEITSRSGHSLSNGHVASFAKRHGVKTVINTDTHSPGDLISDDKALRVALGAGLDEKDFKKMRKNSEALLERIF